MMRTAIALLTCALLLGTSVTPAAATLDAAVDDGLDAAPAVPAVPGAAAAHGPGPLTVEARSMCSADPDEGPRPGPDPGLFCADAAAAASCSAVVAAAGRAGPEESFAGTFVSHASVRVGPGEGGDFESDETATVGAFAFNETRLDEDTTLWAGTLAFANTLGARCGAESDFVEPDDPDRDDEDDDPADGSAGAVHAPGSLPFHRTEGLAGAGGAFVAAGAGVDANDPPASLSYQLGPYVVFVGAAGAHASLNEGCGIDPGHDGSMPTSWARGIMLQVFEDPFDKDDVEPLVDIRGDVPANTGVDLAPFGRIVLNETSPVTMELQDPGTGAARCHRHVAAAHLIATDPVDGTVQAEALLDWVHVSVRSEVPQCRDTVDNDGDGTVDWPDDPHCAGPDDPVELPQPDLVVASLVPVPAEPNLGDDVRLTARVCNVGDAGTGSGFDAGFDAEFRVDGEPFWFVGGEEVPPLGPGACVDLTTGSWFGDPPSGPHVAEVTVDHSNVVREEDETNNAAAAPFVVTAPDLAVVEVLLPPSPNAGDVITYRTRVANLGDGPAGPSRFHVHGPHLEGEEEATFDIDIPGLAPGEEIVVESLPVTLPPGDHGMHAHVNVDGRVPQVVWDNDALDVPFHVTAPDLVVADVALDPPDPAAGDDVVFTVRVDNQGDGPSDPFEVHVNGPGFGFVLSSAALAAGEVVELATPAWTAEPGDHGVHAGIPCVAFEGDCGNNDMEVPFHVAAPDLVVLDLTVDPSAPDHGEAATFRTTVLNRGDGPAGPSDLQFRLDGFDFGPPVAVGALEPGASTAVTSDAWTAEGGEHALEAVADVAGAVPELDEFNNGFWTSFSVAPPDCSDGVDNDGDGLADHPDDPDCASPDDNDEALGGYQA